MKKLINTLLIIVLAFGLSACGGDDDSSSSGSIVGSWKLTNYTENGVPDFDPDDCSYQQTWNFNENGTMRINNYYPNPIGSGCIDSGSPDFGTYQVNGDQLTLSNESIEGTGTFTVSATELVVSDEYLGSAVVFTFQRVN